MLGLVSELWPNGFAKGPRTYESLGFRELWRDLVYSR
jgi:hypothetical protein